MMMRRLFGMLVLLAGCDSGTPPTDLNKATIKQTASTNGHTDYMVGCPGGDGCDKWMKEFNPYHPERWEGPWPIGATASVNGVSIKPPTYPTES